MDDAVATPALELEPPIKDESGYAIRTSDLKVVHLSSNSVHQWRSGLVPLGMTSDEYGFFVDSLRDALRLDGIQRCDVRLKGSCVNLFSGPHKRMPWERDDIADCFRKARRRLPEPHELNYISKSLDEAWPDPAQRPVQRLFDVLYRVRLDRCPSDVDLQISSDEIDERARHRLVELGLSTDSHRVKSPTYDFIRKDLFETVCSHLTLWSAHCTDVLGRTVAIAAFPGSGPPIRTTEPDVLLSSHFRDSDWIVEVNSGV